MIQVIESKAVKPFTIEALVEFVNGPLKPDLSAGQHQMALKKAGRVYKICAELELDKDALNAAFLCAFIPFNKTQFEHVASVFGSPVSDLLHGVSQMGNISAFSQSSQGVVSDENLRKMLIAMVNDVRVVLIKLADQLDLLRNIRNESAQLKSEMAQITLDVYSRLANRLGVWYLKWEMEDYALRYLETKDYHQIADNLDEKRQYREQYIENFIERIKQFTTKAGLTAKVYGRPKHIYSIWRKMKSKGLSFNHILDIRAVRILVDDVSQCYVALGLIHTHWSFLPGEFDDYIATPKPNGYQSIHTAVIGPGDKVVEVQIRTYAMHEENELGVAAHWRYKENTGKDQGVDSKIQWLRQLLEWKDDLGANANLAKQFDSETEDSRIYVFTPKGRVIDLPQGATAIDFAYAIHTEVGHRTRGVHINQKMKSLNTALSTGDQVEIITVKTGAPSRDWIALPGYIKTNRARGRISHWFKNEDRDMYLAHGREKLERALKQQRLNDVSFEKIATSNRFASIDDMMIALGSGEVKLTKLLSIFSTAKSEQLKSRSPGSRGQRQQLAKSDEAFFVQGVGKLKTQIAKCCQPMLGEEIVGYITRGRGITIHQKQCGNLRNMREEEMNRLIDVSWGESNEAAFRVDVSVQAYNRTNLLHDVTNALIDEDVQILKATLEIKEEDSVAIIQLEIEINGQQRLGQVLNQVRNVPNVMEVKRLLNS